MKAYEIAACIMGAAFIIVLLWTIYNAWVLPPAPPRDGDWRPEKDWQPEDDNQFL